MLGNSSEHGISPPSGTRFHRTIPGIIPFSYFILAVIFFEETGFCNKAQAETPSGFGVGFGQLEVKNPEKRKFYEWLEISTDYKEVARMMLADNDTSVWTHCNWFQYLTTERNLKLDGCLGAQVGSHTIYKDLFKRGAERLEKAFNDNDRSAYIAALNFARSNSPKRNGILEKDFPDFWQFILPSSWFELGF